MPNLVTKFFSVLGSTRYFFQPWESKTQSYLMHARQLVTHQPISPDHMISLSIFYFLFLFVTHLFSLHLLLHSISSCIYSMGLQENLVISYFMDFWGVVKIQYTWRFCKTENGKEHFDYTMSGDKKIQITLEIWNNIRVSPNDCVISPVMPTSKFFCTNLLILPNSHIILMFPKQNSF